MAEHTARRGDEKAAMEMFFFGEGTLHAVSPW